MKNILAICLPGIISTLFLSSMAGQPESIVTKKISSVRVNNFQDTAFIKNYIAADKISYLYSKPNLTSKTKIRIPKNVMITTFKRSGNFEYGEFSISSTKSFKGWFLISDLKAIMFSPPKNN